MDAFTFETGVVIATQVQKIPGMSAGIEITTPVLACNPETLKPLVETQLTREDGLPLFKCEETGDTELLPVEFWQLVLQKLGWVEGDKYAVPDTARLKITVENMTPEESSSSGN